jgi:hypothetical protein
LTEVGQKHSYTQIFERSHRLEVPIVSVTFCAAPLDCRQKPLFCKRRSSRDEPNATDQDQADRPNQVEVEPAHGEEP